MHLTSLHVDIRTLASIHAITMLLGEVRHIEPMLSGALPYAHRTIPQVTERKYLCIVKTFLLKLRIHTFKGHNFELTLKLFHTGHNTDGMYLQPQQKIGSEHVNFLQHKCAQFYNKTPKISTFGKHTPPTPMPPFLCTENFQFD